jgi:hypothetical protein
MALGFSQPLGDAWRRTRILLFSPFDLGRWFVIGFTAWLAGLVESGGSLGANFQYVIDRDEVIRFRDWPHDAWQGLEDLLADAWLAGLVTVVVIALLALGLVLLWIGSRGQFMFLDNLAHRRTEVTRPWREFAAQGNSLFLWQVVYTVVVLAVLGGLGLGAFLGVGWLAALDFPPGLSIPFFVVGGIVAFVAITALVYVEFFLFHAVAPVMYRRRCSATEAWRIFGGAFGRHPGSFILFGLLHLVIGLLGGILYTALGVITCCVGLLLMAIPFIGTVVTLPLPTLLRYLDLEFLGQLGPDWSSLDPLPATPAPGYAPPEPDTGSGEFEGDGTVVGPEDVGEDPGGPESRPEDA